MQAVILIYQIGEAGCGVELIASVANLTSTYLNQKRRKQAEELFLQVMETEKRVLGQEHPEMLTKSNLLFAVEQRSVSSTMLRGTRTSTNSYHIRPYQNP
jgi:Tetratricopeptide repeat